MRKNWPQWIGYFTAAVSFTYGLLGLLWTFGGPGFPIGTGDTEFAGQGDFTDAINVTFSATHEVAGPIIAVLGLAGAITALAMTRDWGRGATRTVLCVFAVVLAVGLTMVVQDYRSLILVAYAPMMLVGKALFIWPDDLGFADLFTLPRGNLLVWLLTGIGFAVTAMVYRRNGRNGCGNCGRGEGASTSSIQKWGQIGVIAAVITPLIYCATRWAWALGFSLGIDPEFYRQGQEEGLWIAGAALAGMGMVGAILTLGLIQRWGEIFPRWMIGLRGKPVPPMLAVIPAVLVAVLVTSAGVMYIRQGLFAGSIPDWLVLCGPETLWPIWGIGLFVAAIAYHQRQRGACKVCGRGAELAAGDTVSVG